MESLEQGDPSAQNLELPQEELNNLLIIQPALNDLIAEDEKKRVGLSPLPTEQEIQRQIATLSKDSPKEKDDPLGMKKMSHQIRLRGQVMSQYQDLFEQHNEISKGKLRRTEEMMDSAAAWKHKFTTESRIRKGEDSIYYMSEHGVSQRLKTSRLTRQGLRGVVEPLADRIIFIDEQQSFLPQEQKDRVRKELGENFVDCFPVKAASLEPRIGYSVQEYFSSRLMQEQGRKSHQQGHDYVTLRRHGDLFIVLCDKIEQTHSGHKVNALIK